MTEQVAYDLQQWLQKFIAEQLHPEQVAALADRLNDAIVVRVPQFADHELRRDLQASTVAHLSAFMIALAGNTMPAQPPAKALALARTLARRGLHLRVLMQLYRAGQHAANEFLMERIAEEHLEPGLERALTLRLFEFSTQYVGISLEMLTDTFTEEREIGLRDAFNRRAETVHAILSSETIDTDRASRQLGYRLAGGHVGYVLRADDGVGHGDTASVLDRSANKIAAALGGGAVLTVPSGAHGLWAWVALDGMPDLRVLRDAGPFGDEVAVRVAFGARGVGVDGFRRSHREAVAAQQVAIRTHSPDWLTDYLDVEVVHLVSADAEGLDALIARELAGIDGADASSTRLRATLRAYLGCQKSPEAAARLLGVHKNTVRYRIQRIEELLGHHIDSRRLQLEIALACADRQPPM